MLERGKTVLARQAGAPDFDDLRQRALRPLAMLMLLAAAAGTWYYLPSQTFRWRQASVFCGGILLAVAVLLQMRRRALPAAVLLLAGQYAIGVAAAALLPGTSALLFALPVASAALFAWAPAPLLAAVISCLGQYALSLFLPRVPLLALSAITYCGLGVTLYLTGDALRHTLAWSWKRHIDALRLSEQLRDRQGELNHTVAALDLAYRLLQRTNHELAEARQEAEGSRRLKEQFAANISHELRTPLNLILGFSEMMYLSPHVYGDSGWSPALRRDISQVYTASRHLSQLVDDVLDLSRLDAERVPLRKELCSLGDIAEEAVGTARELMRPRALCLRLELDRDVPRLFLDATRIRQVLLNLLNNAVRFTEAGEIVVRIQRQETEVVVSVSDTGVGIPEQELEHVFEEFYQVEGATARAGKGMGLGLAIAKRFVQMHGGRIWAESSVGLGSTFRVALPLDSARPTASRLRISRAAPPPANPYAESILLLGGGRDMARLLERHIGEGDQGYRVLVADSAEQTRHLAAQDHPQAVICNLSLAKLRALTAELLPRELPPEVPVVYTAIPCAAWRAELLEVKASLQKPVERADLLALLRQVPGVRDVLIVDDDLGFAQMVARMLEATVDEGGEPLRVRMAFGGSEGLEAMRRRPPDLLLLDLRMPEPDGLAVLAAMRAEPILRNVPVVVVTAGDVYDEPGALPIGLVAVAQRGGWGLRDSLKALAALLEVARPSYGEPRSEREEGEMGMATTAADQMAAHHGPTLARA